MPSSSWPRSPFLARTLPRGHARAHRGRREPLAIPPDLTLGLGCDAVGIPAEHGQLIVDTLPRVGCVFADDRQWWWIVPSGSHIGLAWPHFTQYAIGARVATPPERAHSPRPSHGPRLIHRPDDSPYTPPIPLYFVTRHIAAACRLP